VTDAKDALEGPELAGFEARFAVFRGVRLRYLVGGEGPPLMLVHGLGGAAWNWIEVAPALARRRRVLIPDLPGHGRSAALPAAPTLNPFADAVAFVAAREELASVAVAGHSLGGVVALRVALRRPDLVSALLLVAPAGISSSTRGAQVLVTFTASIRPGWLVSPWRGRIARTPWLRALAFWPWAISDPASLSARAVAGLLEGPAHHTDTLSAAWALVRDDPRIDLAGVRCPSLVVAGTEDPQVPFADVVEYARRLRAPLRAIADCGHLPITERPEACVEAIEGFLDRL
jgi:pimeloyl-ACP methyl ester carboxylesterase